MSELEVPLLGGDVTAGVVRVGRTVRRPRAGHSDSVATYLEHLHAVGYRGAPRWHGVDAKGRDILDFMEGDVPDGPWSGWALTDAVLADVAGMLRRLHDASVGFTAPAGARWFLDAVAVTLPPEAVIEGAELVSHCDVTPQNTVFGDGRPIAVIDFDLTGPTRRVVDVINTAVHWLPFRHPADRPAGFPDERVLERLTVLVDGYGLSPDDRAALAATARRASLRSWYRMQANAEQLGGGWARMWKQGVGEQIRRRIEWLTENEEAIERAVLDGPHGR